MSFYEAEVWAGLSRSEEAVVVGRGMKSRRWNVSGESSGACCNTCILLESSSYGLF